MHVSNCGEIQLTFVKKGKIHLFPAIGGEEKEVKLNEITISISMQHTSRNETIDNKEIGRAVIPIWKLSEGNEKI